VNRGRADRLTICLNKQPAPRVGQCGCGNLYSGSHCRIAICSFSGAERPKSAAQKADRDYRDGTRLRQLFVSACILWFDEEMLIWIFTLDYQ
jgi:hypothetical protein